MESFSVLLKIYELTFVSNFKSLLGLSFFSTDTLDDNRSQTMSSQPPMTDADWIVGGILVILMIIIFGSSSCRKRYHERRFYHSNHENHHVTSPPTQSNTSPTPSKPAASTISQDLAGTNIPTTGVSPGGELPPLTQVYVHLYDTITPDKYLITLSDQSGNLIYDIPEEGQVVVSNNLSASALVTATFTHSPTGITDSPGPNLWSYSSADSIPLTIVINLTTSIADTQLAPPQDKVALPAGTYTVTWQQGKMVTNPSEPIVYPTSPL